MVKRSVIIKALVASLLWSTSFASLKIGLEHAEPFFLAGIRCFLAGIILIPFSGHIRQYEVTPVLAKSWISLHNS